jgi:hypothetical protein
MGALRPSRPTAGGSASVHCSTALASRQRPALGLDPMRHGRQRARQGLSCRASRAASDRAVEPQSSHASLPDRVHARRPSAASPAPAIEPCRAVEPVVERRSSRRARRACRAVERASSRARRGRRACRARRALSSGLTHRAVKAGEPSSPWSRRARRAVEPSSRRGRRAVEPSSRRGRGGVEAVERSSDRRAPRGPTHPPEPSAKPSSPMPLDIRQGRPQPAPEPAIEPSSSPVERSSSPSSRGDRAVAPPVEAQSRRIESPTFTKPYVCISEARTRPSARACATQFLQARPLASSQTRGIAGVPSKTHVSLSYSCQVFIEQREHRHGNPRARAPRAVRRNFDTSLHGIPLLHSPPFSLIVFALAWPNLAKFGFALDEAIGKRPRQCSTQCGPTVDWDRAKTAAVNSVPTAIVKRIGPPARGRLFA